MIRSAKFSLYAQRIFGGKHCPPCSYSLSGVRFSTRAPKPLSSVTRSEVEQDENDDVLKNNEASSAETTLEEISSKIASTAAVAQKSFFNSTIPEKPDPVPNSFPVETGFGFSQPVLPNSSLPSELNLSSELPLPPPAKQLTPQKVFETYSTLRERNYIQPGHVRPEDSIQLRLGLRIWDSKKYRFGPYGDPNNSNEQKAEWTEYRTYSGENAKKEHGGPSKSLMNVYHLFDEIPRDKRNKEAFENALGLFLQRNVHRRGHVEFIYAALRRMKEFGVHHDLETYKKLLNIFPKGKMVPQNMIQTEFFHYPKQQNCCIDVLDQIQLYGVHPDKELYDIVKNAFGEWTFAMRKMKRMMYWMPKFRYIEKYDVPRPMPDSPLQCAKLVINRMCPDPATEIDVWLTEELFPEVENTWIVSALSPFQEKLINKHPRDQPLYVEGPFRNYANTTSITYFVLKSDPNPQKTYADFKPWKYPKAEEWAKWQTRFNTELPESRREQRKRCSIHEQQDGTIMAICATGTSTKDSLVCWAAFLEKRCEALNRIPIVFRLKHLKADLVVADSAPNNYDEEDKEKKGHRFQNVDSVDPLFQHPYWTGGSNTQ